jgi:hypothetical protein
MASNINTTDIDAEYPVAGVDNDSQGFRDNFSTIKDNFTAAKAEIEALQNTTARGASYNEETGTNDFNGTTLQEANMIATTEEVYSAGQLENSQNISFLNGHYQTVAVNNNITLTFADWPDSGKLGKIRLALTADGVERTVVWSTENSGVIKYSPDFPSPFNVQSDNNPHIVEAWSSNAGLVVFLEYVGQFTG